MVIPNPVANIHENDIHSCSLNVQSINQFDHIVDPMRFHGFSKIVSVHSKVLLFINKIKARLKSKHPERFGHLHVNDADFNYFSEASKQIILREQVLQYPEIVDYFNSESRKIKDIPNLVSQLNIYMDKDGLLRVKSKCERMKELKRFTRFSFPLLLAKNSRLTESIILDMHEKFSHAGCYSLLAELRKKFWIPHFFTVVKKAIKSCVTCKRYNERTIKLNQSPYRQCRLDPCNIPFSNVYIDYMGPFSIKSGNSQVKVWVLCVTCMWSRAINLKVCINQSVTEFLRAFQLHIFEFGLPQLCISDLGTQLTAGANTIKDFLKDHEV